jgi:cell division protein FtsB
LRNMNAHIAQEEATLKPIYDKLITEAGRVDFVLDLENREAQMLDENRRVLEKKLGKVTQLLDQRVHHIMARKAPFVGKAKQEMNALKKRVVSFKKELSKDKKEYADAVREHEKRDADIQRIHRKIVAALQDHASKTYGKSPQQVQKFLRARAGVSSILSKLYAAQHDMRKGLLIIMGKGKSLALTDQAKFDDELSRLNKDLAVLAKRRDDIEKDIKQLVEKLK